MTSETKSRQDEYIARLNELYSHVGTWIKDARLSVSRDTIELHEEVLGHYEAPALTVLDTQRKKVAELQPAGACIVGAQGRIDLVGLSGREALLYLAKGGPQYETKVTNGAGEENRSKPLFRGVDEAGWYWIERFRPARARHLVKELFLDLVSEVSDYDVA